MNLSTISVVTKTQSQTQRWICFYFVFSFQISHLLDRFTHPLFFSFYYKYSRHPTRFYFISNVFSFFSLFNNNYTHTLSCSLVGFNHPKKTGLHSLVLSPRSFILLLFVSTSPGADSIRLYDSYALFTLFFCLYFINVFFYSI